MVTKWMITYQVDKKFTERKSLKLELSHKLEEAPPIVGGQ